MDHEVEVVSLSNLCGGAIEEVFQREFAEVLANIADINTDAEAKRKITLEFTIQPFEDRSGAQVTFACKSKTVPVNAVKGTVWECVDSKTNSRYDYRTMNSYSESKYLYYTSPNAKISGTDPVSWPRPSSSPMRLRAVPPSR